MASNSGLGCQNNKASCPARATSEGRSVVVRRRSMTTHPLSSDHHSTCYCRNEEEGQRREHLHKCDLRWSTGGSYLAKSRTLLMCWRNCLALSLSGPLCDRASRHKTLPTSGPRATEEMLASLPNSLKFKAGKPCGWRRWWQDPDLCHWRVLQT